MLVQSAHQNFSSVSNSTPHPQGRRHGLLGRRQGGQVDAHDVTVRDGCDLEGLGFRQESSVPGSLSMRAPPCRASSVSRSSHDGNAHFPQRSFHFCRVLGPPDSKLVHRSHRSVATLVGWTPRSLRETMFVASSSPATPTATPRGSRRLRGTAAEQGCPIIIQVGDFGYFPDHPDGPRFLTAVDTACAVNGVELWFIDGNHDDHFALAEHRESDTPVALTDHVTYIPRGRADRSRRSGLRVSRRGILRRLA